ncbi:hypothetical protein QOZ80_9BG0700620 [Eleusine coracana subsp. coracana]|nr:hypothetical protein QOZ80_9BG0700620 [Eleusine coracana subsp. coracana]
MAASCGDRDAGTAQEAFFRPDGEELIDQFLRPKMAGQPLPAAARFIHDADVIAIALSVLAATHAPAPGPPGTSPVWYFFSPVHYYCGERHTRYARRVIGEGYWRFDRRKAKQMETSGGGWYRMRFGFVDRARLTPSGDRLPPEWWMVEHGTTGEETGQQQLVLCELSRSS